MAYYHWKSAGGKLLSVDKKDRCNYAEVEKLFHELEKEICELKSINAAYLEMLENHTATIEMLDNRLRHLLQSEFIRSFDEKDFKTKEYKRNIADADKIALRKNLEFHYEHLDERPILTGDDARAFTKAFIDYLEKRYGMKKRIFAGVTNYEFAISGGNIEKLDMPICFRIIKEPRCNNLLCGVVCGFLEVTPEIMQNKIMCKECFDRFAKHNGKYLLREVKQNDRR